MRKFIITTDSSSDLDKAFIKENDIGVFNLGIVMDDTVLEIKENNDYKVIYDAIRKGVQMTTTAITPYMVEDKFEELLDNGFDILHLSFSSALSSSHANIAIAAASIMEERKEGRVEVIDTVSTTIGLRLIVEEAVNLRSQGKNIDEVINWIEQYKTRVIHQFVVDDLKHLFRGGRISRTSAFVGGSLNIKPVLCLNTDGKIILLKNERGQKRALRSLTKHVDNHHKAVGIKKLIIGHTDAFDKALLMKESIKCQYDINEIIITEINPVIGTHIGADALVLSYIGESRSVSSNKTKCS